MNNLWGEVEGVRRSWGGSCVQVYTESLVWNSRMLSSQVARWELPRCSSGKAGCVLFTIWMRFQASLLRICSLLCTLALLLRLPPGHLAQALLQSVIVDSLEFAYANKCINRCKWEANELHEAQRLRRAPSAAFPSLTLPSVRKPAVVSISAQSFHSERSPSCQDFLLSAGLKFPASLGLHWVTPKLWDWNGRFRMTRNMIRNKLQNRQTGVLLIVGDRLWGLKNIKLKSCKANRNTFLQISFKVSRWKNHQALTPSL